MVNCDSPTEQNCCLKCAYVFAFPNHFFTLTIYILSRIEKHQIFLTQCLTKAHRIAMHEQVAYETSE